MKCIQKTNQTQRQNNCLGVQGPVRQIKAKPLFIVSVTTTQINSCILQKDVLHSISMTTIIRTCIFYQMYNICV